MNGPQFNWQLIPAFLAAYEHGSLMAAARQLGSSQPTMGRHIAELEAQLGTVLFERTGRGLAPTAAGQRLAEAARAMETGAHALLRSVSDTRTALRGTVRLSASQPVACVLLPPILARMRRLLPEIAVELVASNAVSNLLRREADIAVRMVRPEQGALVAQRVGSVGIGVCAHRDYLRRRGTPAQPADLLQHDLVGNDRHDDIAKGFAAMGHSVPNERFVLRTDDLMAYWAAVRAGMGIGFVADYLSRQDPDVLPLLPQLRIPPLPVWLVVHSEIRGNAPIRAVYDVLAAELPPLL
ncbi:MAG: LysR family transcriptional regulator [Hydrogenophaga sp.]|uniref:LysR family transcriptional regulator n=1 Tax=Hydrogenophaga sp. TaxID=1904254 RepID=UPI00272584C0|nr:LysR family transcriptional regulator [Hydrogenophaga sp.]MDO9572115.1 LysR family transcriptional regulator [Hydrogenophaga sp.]MDP3372810.1 LysR family transcriptional regulator [Hydrogenophaga sp.]